MPEIIPFMAPQAPKTEPEAILQFGDIKIRLTLTYLHHLRNCQGWGDRHPNNCFFDGDLKMRDAMDKIEAAMWDTIPLPGSK